MEKLLPLGKVITVTVPELADFLIGFNGNVRPKPVGFLPGNWWDTNRY